MKSENLSELSLTELAKKEKTTKTSLGFFTGILVIGSILIIALLIQKLYYVLAFVLIMSVFPSVNYLKSSKKQLSNIKAELEKRGNNDL